MYILVRKIFTFERMALFRLVNEINAFFFFINIDSELIAYQQALTINILSMYLNF
jgi:hypothetical protein